MNCPVCLIPHDPEIHTATVHVHQWLRRQIQSNLRPVEPGKRNTGGGSFEIRPAAWPMEKKRIGKSRVKKE